MVKYMILFNDLIAVLFSFNCIHCFLLLLNLFINSMFLFEYMIKLHLRKKNKWVPLAVVMLFFTSFFLFSRFTIYWCCCLSQLASNMYSLLFLSIYSTVSQKPAHKVQCHRIVHSIFGCIYMFNSVNEPKSLKANINVKSQYLI